MIRFISETERDEIAKSADLLIAKKKEEIKALETIAHKAVYNDPKGMMQAINNYAAESEKNYFEGKRLSIFVKTGEKISDYDHKEMGTTDDFPAKLSLDDGVWRFHLPPTPSLRLGIWTRYSARHIGYIVRNLIEKYEEINGPISALDQPIVVFEYGLPKKENQAKLYDAENRDSKRIIDSLTGTFFDDDNVLRITTVYYGIESEEACTNVYVLEKDNSTDFFTKMGM